MSELLATDLEVGGRFPALQDFPRVWDGVHSAP
jgi:hypothetical protein